MAPVAVHRVEHKRLRHPNGWKRGPFQGSESLGYSYWVLQANSRHPTPYADGITNKLKDRDICGCANLDQLLDIFTPRDLAFLKDRGFTIRSYMVPPPYVKWGGHQVMFDFTRRVA